MGYLIFTPDPQGAQRGPRSAPHRARSKQNLVRSKIVTNRCCHICFSDDKNVFDIITRPPRGHSGGGGGSGGAFQKLGIWKNVVK